MTYNVLNIITLAFYLILIVCIFIFFIDKKSNFLTDQDAASEDNQDRSIHQIPLSSLRTNYFPEDMKYSAYFIKEYLLEPFNMFLSINPDVLMTLTRIEKAIMILDVELENVKISKEECINRFKQIDIALDEMIEVFSQMINRVEPIISNAEDKETEAQMSNDAILAYIDIVNTMMSLSDTHGTVGWSVHTKIDKIYPDLTNQYRSVSHKLIYLYFVELTSWCGRFDDYITIQL